CAGVAACRTRGAFGCARLAGCGGWEISAGTASGADGSRSWRPPPRHSSQNSEKRATNGKQAGVATNHGNPRIRKIWVFRDSYRSEGPRHALNQGTASQFRTILTDRAGSNAVGVFSPQRKQAFETQISQIAQIKAQ